MLIILTPLHGKLKHNINGREISKKKPPEKGGKPGVSKV
jgi:hypothetical protein